MKVLNSYDIFRNREERRNFLLNNFTKEIKQATSILDVGCSNNELKNKVGNKVIGVDITGNYDIRVDLEKEKLRKFKNEQFNLVVCTDVLEHLNNFHDMVDELFRVTNKYVLISLPNTLNIVSRIRILFRGNLGKYYGLPTLKPSDRHKWLISERDIYNYFIQYTIRNKLKIKLFIFQYNYTNPLLLFLTKIIPIKSLSSCCFILISK